MDDFITKDHRGLDQARPASSQPGHTPYYDHDNDDDDMTLVIIMIIFVMTVICFYDGEDGIMMVYRVEWHGDGANEDVGHSE